MIEKMSEQEREESISLIYLMQLALSTNDDPNTQSSALMFLITKLFSKNNIDKSIFLRELEGAWDFYAEMKRKPDEIEQKEGI
jgi:hypothetical protein